MLSCQNVRPILARNPPDLQKHQSHERLLSRSWPSAAKGFPNAGPGDVRRRSTHQHLPEVDGPVAQAARTPVGDSRLFESQPLGEPGRSGDQSAEPKAPNPELHRTLTLHGRDPSACQSPLQTPKAKEQDVRQMVRHPGGVVKPTFGEGMAPDSVAEPGAGPKGL